MLTPPFTVMILKDSRRPVTIRVSLPLVVIVLFLAGVLLALAVMVSAPFTNGLPVGDDPLPEKTPLDDGIRLAVSSPDTIVGGDTGIALDVTLTGLAVEQSAQGDVEISFEVLGEDADVPLRVWLIMNPHAADVGQIAVVPRGPLFRGLPVDFRNGIEFTPSPGKTLKATIAGELAGVNLEQFRILAYTETGEIAIDRIVSIEQNARM